MLPKKKRLTKKDFNSLKTKVVFRGKYLDIAVSPQKETKTSCIVSKKTLKKAVERNRVRRRIYGILRKETTKNPYFILIYPKQNALKAEYVDIKNEIHTAFATLH